MLNVIRAGLAAALLACALIPALAADKAFERKDLDDAAIKLEAQIKSDAGLTRQIARIGRICSQLILAAGDDQGDRF